MDAWVTAKAFRGHQSWKLVFEFGEGPAEFVVQDDDEKKSPMNANLWEAGWFAIGVELESGIIYVGEPFVLAMDNGMRFRLFKGVQFSDGRAFTTNAIVQVAASDYPKKDNRLVFAFAAIQIETDVEEKTMAVIFNAANKRTEFLSIDVIENASQEEVLSADEESVYFKQLEVFMDTPQFFMFSDCSTELMDTSAPDLIDLATNSIGPEAEPNPTPLGVQRPKRQKKDSPALKYNASLDFQSPSRSASSRVKKGNNNSGQQLSSRKQPPNTKQGAMTSRAPRKSSNSKKCASPVKCVQKEHGPPGQTDLNSEMLQLLRSINEKLDKTTCNQQEDHPSLDAAFASPLQAMGAIVPAQFKTGASGWPSAPWVENAQFFSHSTNPNQFFPQSTNPNKSSDMMTMMKYMCFEKFMNFLK